MNEESINFVSDIFKDLVATGYGCACTLISEDMTFVCKQIIVQV